MPEFVVYEVARATRYDRWMYEVDAETAEEALSQAKACNASEPCHCGEIGEPQQEESGWAVRPRASAHNADQAWEAAWQDCEDEANDDNHK